MRGQGDGPHPGTVPGDPSFLLTALTEGTAKMENLPSYVTKDYRFYHFTMDRLNAECVRIANLPQGEQVAAYQELKKHTYRILTNSPAYGEILRDFLTRIDIEIAAVTGLLKMQENKFEALPQPAPAPGEGAGGPKKQRALKHAVPVEQVGEGKPYLKKKIRLAYDDLRNEICFKKHKIDSLRKGVDDQSTGYEKYRRIELAPNKPDTRHFAYKNPGYKP